MTIYFTWNEFDKSVEYISDRCKFRDFSGVYGIPRGGLCLSVALSHKLNIKHLKHPLKNSLIVDDVYETGHTLNSLKNIENAMFFVLFSKVKPIWWNTIHRSVEREWIVFPWENKKSYLNDKNNFIEKRGLS